MMMRWTRSARKRASRWRSLLALGRQPGVRAQWRPRVGSCRCQAGASVLRYRQRRCPPMVAHGLAPERPDANLPDSAPGCSFRVDGDAAPLLGCDVMQGLGERPAMSGGVADGALTLSVRKIVWLADDLAAVLADAVAQGGDGLH